MTKKDTEEIINFFKRFNEKGFANLTQEEKEQERKYENYIFNHYTYIPYEILECYLKREEGFSFLGRDKEFVMKSIREGLTSEKQNELFQSTKETFFNIMVIDRGNRDEREIDCFSSDYVVECLSDPDVNTSEVREIFGIIPDFDVKNLRNNESIIKILKGRILSVIKFDNEDRTTRSIEASKTLMSLHEKADELHVGEMFGEFRYIAEKARHTEGLNEQESRVCNIIEVLRNSYLKENSIRIDSDINERAYMNQMFDMYLTAVFGQIYKDGIEESEKITRQLFEQNKQNYFNMIDTAENFGKKSAEQRRQESLASIMGGEKDGKEK